MRKAVIAAIILLLGITIVMAVNDQGKNKIKCNKECTINSRTSEQECKTNYTETRDMCKDAFKNCMNETKTFMKNCTEFKGNMTEFRNCIKESSERTRQCVKNNSECDKNNRGDFLGCLKEVRTEFTECKEVCKESGIDQEGCKKLGGTWNPCTTPCVNNSEVCAQVCVPKCEFKMCQTAADCRTFGLKKFNCVNNICIKDP